MRIPKPTWKRSFAVIAVSLMIIATSFVIWANSANPIMADAEAALNSSAGITVTHTDAIVFTPDDPSNIGFILYPGGRVLAEAYAPLTRAIAEAGHTSAIVKVPLNLAFFNINGAQAIIDAHPDVESWVIAGHSLGGVAATVFANGNRDQVDGLVLLASYPADASLADSDIEVVSIYGTADGVANLEALDASRDNLPADAVFVAIEGGNHAQFGDYGDQDGDNPATITREEQQQQTINAILNLIERLR